MPDLDVEGAAEAMRQRQRDAATTMSAWIDDPPDEAARAMELSGATGVPADVIHGDLEGFQRLHKQRLAANIVRMNPQLSDYILGNSMHAPVSNDDLGNLDNITTSWERYNAVAQRPWYQVLGAGMERGVRENFSGTIDALGYLTGKKELRDFATQMQEAENREVPMTEEERNTFSANVGSLIGNLVGLLPAGVLTGGSGALVQMALAAGSQQLKAAEAKGADTEKAATAFTLGFATGGAIGALPLGVLEGAGGSVLKKSLMSSVTFGGIGEAQELISQQIAKTYYDPNAGYKPDINRIMAGVAVGGALGAFFRNGENPPPGVDKGMDTLHEQQAREGKQALNEVLQNIGKSQTGVRAPEALDRYLALHPDASVTITPEGLKILYSDELPAQDDGKLGDSITPEQYVHSLTSGQPIPIKLSDYAKVNPDIQEALEDHLIHAEDDSQGMSINEGEVLKEQREAQQPEKIKGATYTVGGKSYEGANHVEAMDKAVQELGLEGTDQLIDRQEGEGLTEKLKAHGEAAGFMTSRGRVVGREEAGKISEAADQGKASRAEGTLKSEDIKDLTPEEALKQKTIEVFDAVRTGAAIPTPKGVPNLTVEGSGQHWLVMEGNRIRGSRPSKAEAEKLATKLGTEGPKQPKPKEPKQLDLGLPEEEKMPTGEEALREALGDRQFEKWASKAKRFAASMSDMINEMERRRQTRQVTKEWKEKAKSIREEAERDIMNRRDIALDEFLRNGKIVGNKVSDRPAIDIRNLTEEQIAGIDEDFLREKRGHKRLPFEIDELARMFNFDSGEQVLETLKRAEEVRRTHALGPKEWLNKTIDSEVEARLEKEFGSLDENILAAVRERLVSPTTMEWLHEDLIAAGMQAYGPEFKLEMGGKSLEEWVKGQFLEQANKGQTVKSYLRAAGMAGRRAEQHMLKDKPNWVEAFKEKQDQLVSMMFAQEAAKFEKQKAAVIKTAKRFSKRDVEGVPVEYTNAMHSILMKLGLPVNRTAEDIAKIFGDKYKDLHDFWFNKNIKENRNMQVASFLLDPAYSKPLKDMTVSEFKAVHDTFTSVLHNARDEQEVTVRAQKRWLSDVIDQAVGILDEKAKEKVLVGVPDPHSKDMWSRGRRFLQTVNAGLLQMEFLLDRWERGDHTGLFTQLFGYKGAAAANRYDALIRETAAGFKNLPKFQEKEGIENNLFIGANRLPMKMNRGSLIRVLLNMGNLSNREKLINGEAQWAGMKPEEFALKLDAWIDKVATEADFKIAEGMFRIYDKLKVHSDAMELEMSGLPAEDIPALVMKTKFGEFKGGYSPMIYDKSRRKPGTTEDMPDNAPPGAWTPRRHMKQRTDFYGPIDLDFGAQQMYTQMIIRDIALRPFISEARKIIFNNDFQNAVTRNYGKAYADMAKNWLEDLGHSRDQNIGAAKAAAAFSDYVRSSLVASLIGLNPGTVFKHGSTALINSMTEVGIGNFSRELTQLMHGSQEVGLSNWNFAMKHSQQLQSRHAHFNDSLGGASDQMMGRMNLPQKLAYYGAKPVALADLASAVPTWLAAYKLEMERLGKEGKSDTMMHEGAVAFADRAVRRAHGSTSLSSRPGFMRGGAMSRWFTSLYGFFNHIFNRQYEMMWRANQVAGRVKAGEMNNLGKDLGRIAIMATSYLILPALVEELVTPLTNDEKESWGHKAATGLLRFGSASVPLVRDATHAILSDHDPEMGLMTQAAKQSTHLLKDVKSGKIWEEKHFGDTLQHATELVGTFSGFPVQAGKTGKFLYNYMEGREKPKGFWQHPFTGEKRRSFLGGVWHGTVYNPQEHRKVYSSQKRK